MTSYRYPNEQIILALTLGLVFVVIAITSVATLCGSALFVLVMLVISYLLNRSHHNELIARSPPGHTPDRTGIDRPDQKLRERAFNPARSKLTSHRETH